MIVYHALPYASFGSQRSASATTASALFQTCAECWASTWSTSISCGVLVFSSPPGWPAGNESTNALTVGSTDASGAAALTGRLASATDVRVAGSAACGFASKDL